jgi:hypothetical protein
MRYTRETHLDLPKECDNVVSRALAGENAIFIMGCLIFLALANGDAFALDIDDKYGCPLCVDGEKQRYPLFDTGPKWCFKWPWRYSVVRGLIYFENRSGEDSSGLPWMEAGAIKRALTRYNRKAGTNYHL